MERVENFRRKFSTEDRMMDREGEIWQEISVQGRSYFFVVLRSTLANHSGSEQQEYTLHRVLETHSDGFSRQYDIPESDIWNASCEFRKRIG